MWFARVLVGQLDEIVDVHTGLEPEDAVGGLAEVVTAASQTL